MGNLNKILDGLKPMMMMVTVQLALTGVNILYKMVANNGVSLPILIAYRFLFAAATVIPLALVLERKSRPKLTWKIILQAFACALFGGSMAQNLYAESLVLTSATFAAAISNLIPAITLILAVIFRLEALGLKAMAGKAKLMGTFFSIGGAMLLTFYKGPKVNFLSTNIDLLHKSQTSEGHVAAAHHSSGSMVLGLLLALACCFSISVGLIVQTKMSESYPCHYSSTALIAAIGSVQAIVYAVCIERDRSKWKLGWNLTLLTAAYMGVLASGIMWVFIMLCVRMRGPLYVSVFNPLLLVLVALAGSLFLNEKLYLGSVVGAAVIVCGLYLVLWGKGKEMKKMSRLMASKNATIGETTRESFKGLSHGNNVVVVTPNFVPELESSDVFDEDQEQEDSEPKVSITNIKS
ncbi:WAT1-related protein At1g25270-like [Salvia miltiorrhiza]|uniref:WAT1-related protein At1g25270-like n=1 Tax=Salvia miltiorrhiza TaxID=226208 RepID=UPI0025AD4A3C|nr:WAT1-related protein At1g25270-like [Salvia miltiorrhiza]